MVVVFTPRQRQILSAAVFLLSVATQARATLEYTSPALTRRCSLFRNKTSLSKKAEYLKRHDRTNGVFVVTGVVTEVFIVLIHICTTTNSRHAGSNDV